MIDENSLSSVPESMTTFGNRRFHHRTKTNRTESTQISL